MGCVATTRFPIKLQDLDPQIEEAFIAHLSELLTPEKRERMEQVIALRTSCIQVVLEDIFQPHNASAVMRSCECFGIQNLHVIENKNKYVLNREVAMGSSKWIHLHRYREPGGQNTSECLASLREQGCRIVATSLDPSSIPLDQLPLDQKTALCFGTEEDGLSRTILDEADAHVHIPMFGFTQSFNISVSAALCLHDLRKRLPDYTDDWQLQGAEKREALLLWLRNSVRNYDIQERVFLQDHTSH